MFNNKINLFSILTKFLIMILPFYVIIKVYLDKILGLGFLGFFIKEFIIILLILSLIYEYSFNKDNKIKFGFDKIDYFILSFIIYGILITFINGGGLKEIIYGGRYDFLGFIVFLIYKHGKIFLKGKLNKYIKLFFISGGISLFLGIMVKFILGEDILLLLGFTDAITKFGFGGGIPIYQGVEASGIRRFQGILDSPLAMGYFLILFSGLYLHINRKNIDYGIIMGFIILFSLIFLTYSRAAILGILVGLLLLFLLSLKKIIKKYKKTLFFSLISVIIVFGTLSYVFQDKIYNVVLRKGSSSDHISRMIVGYDRFTKKPLGSGLASAGPAYRNIIKEKTTLETDRYYIPESWYIQILIEGGIIYLGLFLIILYNILSNLYFNNKKYIFSMFIGILVMNIFLHTFEYTYLTILLFLFLGLFYNSENLQKKH